METAAFIIGYIQGLYLDNIIFYVLLHLVFEYSTHAPSPVWNRA